MERNQAINSERAAPQPNQPLDRRGKKGKRPGLLLTICTAIYCLILLSLTAANVIGPERWWLGSANLYLPQWIWALPWLVILPWYLHRAQRWTWIPLALGLWVFGPIMGWSFGLARFAPRPEGVRLRVMTYNVKWGTRSASAVIGNIRDADPDIVLMQDSAGSVDNVLSRLKRPGWYVAQLTQYTVLSRFPISDVTGKWMLPGMRHACLRGIVKVGARKITLFDVHLMTPRYALGTLRNSGAEGAEEVQQNAKLRLQEAAGLAEHLQPIQGPIIVAGDFNAPVQSLVCRTVMDRGLKDAHSESGWGYGYSYGQSTRIRRPFVRIDHILVSPDIAIVSCREGGPRGSDHSPIIADLIVR